MKSRIVYRYSALILMAVLVLSTGAFAQATAPAKTPEKTTETTVSSPVKVEPVSVAKVDDKTAKPTIEEEEILPYYITI